jgi:hypothetical protein
MKNNATFRSYKHPYQVLDDLYKEEYSRLYAILIPRALPSRQLPQRQLQHIDRTQILRHLDMLAGRVVEA